MTNRAITSAVAAIALALLMSAGGRDQTPVLAEDVLGRVLGAASAGLTQRVGEYIWIEEEGIGVKLDPVPTRSSRIPRLIAGRALPGGATVGLWRLGGAELAQLRRALGSAGVEFGESTEFSFQPEGMPNIRGTSTRVSFEAGTRGLAARFEADGRHFALVIAMPGGSGVTASGLRDEILSDLVILPQMTDGAVAPLFLEGRYACMLAGWERSGERFHRVSSSGGWQGMRIFIFDGDEFSDLGKLQVSVESALKQSGHERAGGRGFTFDGRRAFDGEYFGDGYIHRVVYLPLGGAYLVALFSGSEKDRTALGVESELFSSSITRVDLGRRKVGPAGMGFHRVRRLRAVAWQDGGLLVWGVLFDDGRQNPVLWRQWGVTWSARLVQRNVVLARQIGEADSSRELNPLLNAKDRALAIPTGTKGEVELQIGVGRETATFRLTLEDVGLED